MSANQTFNPDNPREALAMLDSLLGLDTMNFNRSMHNGIQRAVASLYKVIDERDELLTRPALVLVDPPPSTAGPETESAAQSAS